MLGKLSVGLMLLASPALAQDTPPVDQSDNAQTEAPEQAYETKKVCRSVEVVGSSIPRTTCTTKRVPIEPNADDHEADRDEGSAPEINT